MSTNFKQNLKSGLFWMGLFKTSGQAFIWANTIIIARFLEPGDYGLVGMANLITSFVALIGDFGFGLSIVQKKDLESVHVHSLFWITVSIGLLILFILHFGAPIAVLFFQNSEIIPILRLSAVALFFSIISDIPMKMLLRDLRYKSSGVVDFVSNLTASICVLILAIRGYGAYSLVFGSIITGIFKFLLACIQNRWLPQAKFQARDLKDFVKFGGNIVISRILWYIYSNADQAILAQKLGKVPFGLYSFAFNLSSIPTSKLQPIIQPVFFSSFSRIQDDLPLLREQYLKIIDIMFTCYAMVYCGFFWISPEFVKIVLGSKWEPIIPVLQILLLVQPLRAISSGSPPIAMVVGRSDMEVKTMIVFISFMVPSFFIASHWGMMGVALAWCVVYPIAFLINIFMRLRVVQIPLLEFLAQLLPGLKFTSISSLMILSYKVFLPLLYNPQNELLTLWLNLVGAIIIGILSNLAVLWFFERRYIEQAKAFLKV